MKLKAVIFAYLAIAAAYDTESFAQATRPQMTAPATQPTGPIIVRLTLHPSLITSPALKYELLPPLTEMRPGDAAYNYQWAGRSFPSYGAEDKKFLQQFDKASDSDRESFSVADATAITERINMERIHDAARCEDARWDTNYRNKGLDALLPYANDIRAAADAVEIEGRLAIAQNNFPKAVHSLQTEFSMVQQLRHDPFLVQSLVGAGIGRLALDKIASDWVSKSKSPNLFWPLVNLRSSMIDWCQTERMERSMLAFTDTPYLAEALDGTLPVDQWQHVFEYLVGWNFKYDNNRRQSQPGPAQDAEVDHQVAIDVAADLGAARAHLRSTGINAADALAMPDVKAVGTYWIWQYKIVEDEQYKGWILPYPQGAKLISLADKQKAKLATASHNPLLQMRFSGLSKGYFALWNLDREIAAMSLIEALRDYVASHDGAIPASLDQVTELPLPPDPITGNSFLYRREKNMAIIDAPAPTGIDIAAGRRYELTFEK